LIAGKKQGQDCEEMEDAKIVNLRRLVNITAFIGSEAQFTQIDKYDSLILENQFPVLAGLSLGEDARSLLDCVG
jgi:hypothetical protein